MSGTHTLIAFNKALKPMPGSIGALRGSSQGGVV